MTVTMTIQEYESLKNQIKHLNAALDDARNERDLYKKRYLELAEENPLNKPYKQ